MKSREFTVTVNDTEKTVVVNSPSSNDQKEANKVYNTAFTDALKSKAVVRARLDDLLVDQGLWDDSKQLKFEELQRKILENEKELAKGGISLSQARKLALEMRENRSELRELISVKTNLDTHTAEGQADNARFNFLVSACSFYKDGNKKVFNNYEDYLNRQNEKVSIKAAQTLANMIYGLDNDYENNLPENQFLKNYNFVDEKLRLIDKEGRLVDSDGRLLNEDGRFINEQGEFIDKYGNLLNEDGEYKVEFTPFLDDEGNPVSPPKTPEKKEESPNEVEEKSES
jgi:hypothetical protein